MLAVARAGQHRIVILGSHDVRREQELALGRTCSSESRQLGDLPAARCRIAAGFQIDAPDVPGGIRGVQAIDVSVRWRAVGVDAIEERDVRGDRVRHIEQLAGIALAGVAAAAALRLPDDAAVESIENEDASTHRSGGRRFRILVERIVVPGSVVATRIPSAEDEHRIGMTLHDRQLGLGPGLPELGEAGIASGVGG